MKHMSLGAFMLLCLVALGYCSVRGAFHDESEHCRDAPEICEPFLKK